MDITEQFMSLLLPILIILIIGIVVLSGWLVWVFTRRRNRQSAAAGLGVPAPAGRESAPFYLLGVKRGEEEGAWEVHVQGIRYPHLAAVPDPQIRSDVKLAMSQVAAFIGEATQPLPASRPMTRMPEAESTAPRRASAPAPLGAATESAPRRAATPGGLMPVIDFAHEITEIIEELQAQSPGLQAHAVSLQNVPGGGINFLVDGKIYADITEVPYPEMQTLIRRATREWERR